jgi:hypothetical protein
MSERCSGNIKAFQDPPVIPFPTPHSGHALRRHPEERI